MRKSVLIRRIIASHLCTAVGYQQFRKESENVKRELCLNIIIPFSITVCCLIVTLCSKSSILSEPKWGHKQPLEGGHGPPAPPPLVTALPGSHAMLYIPIYPNLTHFALNRFLSGCR